MNPVYFETPDDFRAWLEQNHFKAGFLLVGFHKKGTGQPSMTWPRRAVRARRGRRLREQPELRRERELRESMAGSQYAKPVS